MLKEKLKDFNIILASGSPRRQQFLKDLDIPFTIDVRKIDEIYPNHLRETEITDYLANLKAQAFSNLRPKDILITSDTIVWLENRALGKPKNEEEAFNMLKSLSNKTHKVITSVSIKTSKTQRIVNDVTSVSFRKLSDEEINYYIKKYKPLDKAGAYGIQEWIGFTAITKIEGSYFNVVGLPIHKLYKELMNL